MFTLIFLIKRGDEIFQLDSSDILQSVRSIVEGESDFIANCANISSILYHTLDKVNWCGFYFLKEGMLVLGPFQGKPACIRIPLGRGVCGTVAEEGETIVVEDVHAFKGHIACDGDTQSEMVLPIISKGELLGVLDMDSPIKSRFTKQDQDNLEEVVRILINTIEK